MGDSLPFKISSFVIQQLPEIQDKICYQQDWESIANYQKQNYLIANVEEQNSAMELMMSGIDDVLEEPICATCGEAATNRCSKCHHEWYCSRKCQVSAWKKHKEICALLTKPENPTEKEHPISQKIIDLS